MVNTTQTISHVPYNNEEVLQLPFVVLHNVNSPTFPCLSTSVLANFVEKGKQARNHNRLIAELGQISKSCAKP